MSRIDFDTPEALADDLAGCFGLSQAEVRDKLTERNWRRIALIYNRLLNLIEEGATYFARAAEIRRNPEWTPNRPIRAELKLAKINQKVDRTESKLFQALGIAPSGAQHSLDPLAPRSLAYLIPVLEAEADRREAEARRDRAE